MLGEEASRLLDRFEPLFSKVLEFIGGALETRGPYDGVAYWVEQTFKVVQRIEKRPSVALSTTPTAVEPSIASNTRKTWASVAARRPPPLSKEETSLREVKVWIEDKIERKALWTTPNNMVLAKVAAGTGEAGVVGVRKFPSGDIII
jgi:hypothetical protein